MKPLNRAERTTAFLRFLLLFIITLALIFIVVFYSIRVPVKASEQLQKSLSTLQNEKQLSDSFNVVMQEAVADLNRFSERKESPEATNHRVQNKIVVMNSLLRKIPNGENSLYALMIQNLSELSDAKKKMAQARTE